MLQVCRAPNSLQVIVIHIILSIPQNSGKNNQISLFIDSENKGAMV